MPKKYKWASENIKLLVSPMGSCLASDKITVDGAKVGYMYRERPSDAVDSGWRFFAGSESEQYTATASNFSVYDVNTIANYDPSIVAFLGNAAPCAFARDDPSDQLSPAQPSDCES